MLNEYEFIRYWQSTSPCRSQIIQNLNPILLSPVLQNICGVFFFFFFHSYFICFSNMHRSSVHVLVAILISLKPYTLQHHGTLCMMAGQMCGLAYSINSGKYQFHPCQAVFPLRKQGNVWTWSQAKPDFIVYRTQFNFCHFAEVQDIIVAWPFFFL